MQISDNRVYLGGVSAERLAEEFGTPLFVIEEDVIRRQCRSIFEGVPYRPLTVFYACKANWNVQVMRVLREEGARLDACSPGDVHLAFAAGYTTDEILYTGYAVSNEELRFILEHNLSLNVDSLSQLTRYAKLGGRGKIGIRVNTGVQAGFHVHVTSATPSSKFGLHPTQLEEAKNLAAAHGLTIAGLHTHLGSDILQDEPFLKALDVLLTAAERFEGLEYIDLGGGLGVPFAPYDKPFDMAAYGKTLNERLSKWCRQCGQPLALYMEPGEYMVAQSAYLLTRVVDIKPSVPHGDGRTPTFIGTDASFNHVFATAIYDAYHKIHIADRAMETSGERVHICGNLMQAGDVLAKDRLLPPLREGDLLVMENCGAYAMCRASRFNARPLPAEVMVKDGQARLVRQRETLQDLLTNQVLE